MHCASFTSTTENSQKTVSAGRSVSVFYFPGKGATCFFCVSRPIFFKNQCVSAKKTNKHRKNKQKKIRLSLRKTSRRTSILGRPHHHRDNRASRSLVSVEVSGLQVLRCDAHFCQSATNVACVLHPQNSNTKWTQRPGPQPPCLSER